MEHSYIIVVSRFKFYDIGIAKMTLYYDDDESHTLSYTTCDSPDWGMPSPLKVKSPDKFPLPTKMELVWNAVMEGKRYELSTPLNQTRAEELWQIQSRDFPDDPFRQYIIGIGPYGGVAVWLCSKQKSVLLDWLTGQEAQWKEDEPVLFSPSETGEELLNLYMPCQTLQDNMRQHPYRYIPLEEYYDGEKWLRFERNNSIYEAIDLDGVEDKRLDGSFDFSGNDAVLRYHEAGKPYRITVRWHENDEHFYAHFWLNDITVTSYFNGFFKRFPDAQADLLLRIDTRANRYEVAMTGEGLPVRALRFTQYIVFREDEEIARSENFILEDEEWLWN